MWRWALLLLGSQCWCLGRTWLTQKHLSRNPVYETAQLVSKCSEVPKPDLRWRSSWAFAQGNKHAWGNDPQVSQQPEDTVQWQDHVPGSRMTRPNKHSLTSLAACPSLPVFVPLLDKSAGYVTPLPQQSRALSLSLRDLDPALIIGISNGF